MKLFPFLLFSAAIHTAVILGGAFSPLQESYVQKGVGSVEMEIILPKDRIFKKVKPKKKRFLTSSTLAQPHASRPGVKPVQERVLGGDQKMNQHKDGTVVKITLLRSLNYSMFIQEILPAVGQEINQRGQKMQLQSLVVPFPEEVGSLDKAAPHLLVNPVPRYPKMAILKGWEGEVLVKIKVGQEGMAVETTLLKSSGYSVLDQEALRALKEWCFEKGFTGEYEIPIEFVLNDL